ncbi:MAG TPA: hypothetical protein VFE86_05440 [Ilumatobacteraceae bacterium]|nr:hypothetical protein [Ilumatobacteraceae bacterium]
MTIIPPPETNSVTIFDTDPGPATEVVFNQGILSTNTDNESLSIVLFSPNLQLIASLDNTQSEVTSTYTTSISHGFTFSSTQSLSITNEVGVNIEVVSAKVSVTFALSFTEQWTTDQTRSMTFECPPGKKAFVYQGTLMSKLMSFSAADAQYTWVSAASKALTEVLVTTDTPIGSAPSNAVSIQS